MDYAKFEKISIKNHPELNEKWVQDPEKRGQVFILHIAIFYCQG